MSSTAWWPWMLTQPNPKLREVAKAVCRGLRKTRTEAERLFWEELRDRKLNGLKFYRQYPLFVEWLGNETFFVADFFCFERQLVVELDGCVHDYRVDHDRLRTFIMNQQGIQVVRFRNEQIETDLVGVIEQLRRALLERSGR